jgi:hypothetical protein
MLSKRENPDGIERAKLNCLAKRGPYPNGIPSASVGGHIGRDRALFAAAAAAAAADRYVTAVASHHVVVIAHSMGVCSPTR